MFLHFFTELFVVDFVQTTYTVVESEGPVEVCVNLTRPPVDILEETVRVRVTNDEGSIYIPTGVRLASESQHYCSNDDTLHSFFLQLLTHLTSLAGILRQNGLTMQNKHLVLMLLMIKRSMPQGELSATINPSMMMSV